MTTGVVSRVAGPLIEADLAGVAMAELVEVGPNRLPAEVVSVRVGGVVTLQAYEYTGGIRPGHPVWGSGRPLAARLGPWLLGGVFDGMLRSLHAAPTWLEPGGLGTPDTRQWDFQPTAIAGVDVSGGIEIGTVAAGPVPFRLLVPPGVAGRLRGVVAPGRYQAVEPLAYAGDTAITLEQWWPVRQPRPCRIRLRASAPLLTGQRVVDSLFPITKGGTAAVPGGFGTGKTVLLQQIAKWCDADVIVYVGCGERGNEMADVVTELAELADPRTGGQLSQRTVIIANTSNMPIMAREASIYTGVTVAEYFRDMGLHAVVIADSTSRWAEAVREFASRNGALPAEEGYPAGLASALAAFYERAAWVRTLGDRDGSVTVIGAVSPPGGDMTEPVTSYTQRFVRTLWTLDRDLAYGRQYPAITWRDAYSRDADAVGGWFAQGPDPEWASRRAAMVGILAEADRLTALAELVGVGALPGHERMAMLGGRLIREAVLQQNSLSTIDATCPPVKAAALADVVLRVVRRGEQLVASGVPAAVIEELDFSPLVRCRETLAAQATLADAERACQPLLAELDGLT